MARVVASTLLVLACLWAIALPTLPCLRHPLLNDISVITFRIGGLICHQRPDRSFVRCDSQWAVCGRCAGLYLGALLGSVTAAVGVVRRDTPWGTWRRVVLLAALPTAALWTTEMAGLWDPGTRVRWAGALPLGATTAAWLVAVARGDLR